MKKLMFLVCLVIIVSAHHCLAVDINSAAKVQGGKIDLDVTVRSVGVGQDDNFFNTQSRYDLNVHAAQAETVNLGHSITQGQVASFIDIDSTGFAVPSITIEEKLGLTNITVAQCCSLATGVDVLARKVTNFETLGTGGECGVCGGGLDYAVQAPVIYGGHIGAGYVDYNVQLVTQNEGEGDETTILYNEGQSYLIRAGGGSFKNIVSDFVWHVRPDPCAPAGDVPGDEWVKNFGSGVCMWPGVGAESFSIVE